MAGRFSVRRNPVAQPQPQPAPVHAPAQDVSPASDAPSWSVLAEPAQPAPAPAAVEPPAAANPLHTDKLLDAKVRLHRRLLEEVNLQALEKLPEDQMREHIQKLV